MTGFKGPEMGAGVQTFLRKAIGDFSRPFREITYRNRQSSFSDDTDAL